jgi:hypothetical protein
VTSPINGTSRAAPASYLGSWFLTFPEVCAGAPEENDGMLTYTAREFIGLEDDVRILAGLWVGKHK